MGLYYIHRYTWINCYIDTILYITDKIQFVNIIFKNIGYYFIDILETMLIVNIWLPLNPGIFLLPLKQTEPINKCI